MLNHILIGSNDIEKAKSFYDAVLGVIGVPNAIENINNTGQTRLLYMHDGSVFGVTQPINEQPACVANGFTVGFRCNSPEQVKEFHDVALANGATPAEEPPGPRDTSIGLYHACYFLDLDGHKVCGIFQEA